MKYEDVSQEILDEELKNEDPYTAVYLRDRHLTEGDGFITVHPPLTK